MSRILSMDLRLRWRSRSVILKRWLEPSGPGFEPGEPVCELIVDGKAETFRYEAERPGDLSVDYAGPYWTYVLEGQEVGPSGHLFQYGSSNPKNPHWRRLDSSSRARFRPIADRPDIFLSYRRADAEAYAGRLHEKLAAAFGLNRVFMDQFSIPPGEPFRWVVQQAAASCSAMIVLLGPKWLSVTNNAGERRLASEYDLLRREVCAALDRGIYVIPVLTPGAEPPSDDNLPDELKGLEELQYLALTPRHWKDDTDLLVNHLRRAVEASQAVPPEQLA